MTKPRKASKPLRASRDPLFGCTKPPKVYDSPPQSKSRRQNLRSANYGVAERLAVIRSEVAGCEMKSNAFRLNVLGDRSPPRNRKTAFNSPRRARRTRRMDGGIGQAAEVQPVILFLRALRGLLRKLFQVAIDAVSDVILRRSRRICFVSPSEKRMLRFRSA